MIAVISIVVGVGGLIDGLAGAVDSAPKATFPAGQETTVRLDPADAPAIYVSTTGARRFTCGITGGGGPARLQQPVGRTVVTGTNGISWELGLRVGVDKAGDYQVTCDAEPAEGITFGVGREVAAGAIVGGVLALIGIPSLGILLAVVVTVVVLIKRRNARRRQASAGQAPAAGQWAPGPHGG
ncbi:hypothetical protein ACLQ2R_12000 [Streptosporangium sp. DT93]|uniref:hypothetical protein n=1 Tax=Streptosporangium sp. DT93 TaxID=3393428 RepID=UPI003CEB170F